MLLCALNQETSILKLCYYDYCLQFSCLAHSRHSLNSRRTDERTSTNREAQGMVSATRVLGPRTTPEGSLSMAYAKVFPIPKIQALLTSSPRLCFLDKVIWWNGVFPKQQNWMWGTLRSCQREREKPTSVLLHPRPWKTPRPSVLPIENGGHLGRRAHTVLPSPGAPCQTHKDCKRI